MSLYYEASDILANTEAKGGSLKNRIFGKKDLKSSPGAIFALVAETTKWSSVLKEVIEKSDILKLEKKVGLACNSLCLALCLDRSASDSRQEQKTSFLWYTLIIKC
jgi:putative methyltransferase